VAEMKSVPTTRKRVGVPIADCQLPILQLMPGDKTNRKKSGDPTRYRVVVLTSSHNGEWQGPSKGRNLLGP